MNLEDIEIGQEFYRLAKNGFTKWRCTDKGTRTMAAICLDDHPDDPSWFNGPPYAVAEYVIDEDDLEVCFDEEGMKEEMSEEYQGFKAYVPKPKLNLVEIGRLEL